uniref:Gamma-glutamylcyclotransferase family protein n=1 Tax=Crassostrea virginica TaxID=6565 RepID=A0A8B8BPS5_CRAVI|nr:gamma-glutamylaminecyclotransferase-like [Crassostrea virginica]XP_022305342.1 gamma-glutamylaminecyclotransferase-like [Crassostrea virginica]XP_022305343.1 gamma-glutamylaminecyclotransferase-like [Crassostrea virginica]
MNRVFVYGTLKNGQPNHFRLMDPGSGTSSFIGQGQTLEKYPLVIERSWNMPCLLNLPGSGLIVKGEIYDVDDQKMKFLDFFEDHPELYTRTRISVKHVSDSSESQISTDDFRRNSPRHLENASNALSECWCYFYQDIQSVSGFPHVDSYDSKGDHGLQYDARVDADFDEKKT